MIYFLPYSYSNKYREKAVRTGAKFSINSLSHFAHKQLALITTIIIVNTIINTVNVSMLVSGTDETLTSDD